MVNLSGRELLQLGLSDTICRLVDRHGVSRQNLLFEIQETWSSLDEEHIDQSIHDLRKAGFSIAIDKFGTRHSSPRCLSQARFLKLSQHLLEASHHDRLRAAFSVAEGLQISPISVGIESEQQLRNVFHLGCRVFQGHLLSPDVHAQQVQVLARQLWRYRTE